MGSASCARASMCGHLGIISQDAHLLVRTRQAFGPGDQVLLSSEIVLPLTLDMGKMLLSAGIELIDGASKTRPELVACRLWVPPGPLSHMHHAHPGEGKGCFSNRLVDRHRLLRHSCPLPGRHPKIAWPTAAGLQD